MSFVYNYEYKITSASFSERISSITGSGGTTTGSFTGSFTGNLQGTASFANNALSSSYAGTASILLGSVVSASYALTASFALNGGGGGGTTFERRHDFQSPYDYCGVAPDGTSESTPNWTITRLNVALNGTATTGQATGSWTNRTELIYNIPT